MAQKGTLVIADITGYTAFLSGSELEHAQDSLGHLLNLLLSETKAPLKVANLEGDAIFTYAVEGSYLQGQTLVEAIEQTYVVFRRALQQMVLNTTCTCNACKNIPSLDLKFFVHHGEFGIQKLGSRVDLVGTDVTLLHRLTKNTITETLGLVAYAAYTEAAVKALDAADLCAGMISHSEGYDHLGEVGLLVQDMGEVWERERDRARISVDPSEAVATVEYTFEVSPVLTWDYTTKPEFRAILMDSDGSKTSGEVDGRIGPDTTYYCAHGDSVFPQTIVDWRPLQEYSFMSPTIMGSKILATVTLVPVDGGRKTRTTTYFGHGQGGNFLGRFVSDLYCKFFITSTVTKGCRALAERLEQDLASGLAVNPEVAQSPVEMTPEAIAATPTG